MNIVFNTTFFILLLSGNLLGAKAIEPVELPLAEVLLQIEKRYEVVFSYNTKHVKNINIEFGWKKDESFEMAINRALENTDLKYKSVGLNFYIIFLDNKRSRRKFRKIEKKIQEIRNLGDDDNFIISEDRSISKSSSTSNHKTISGQIKSHSNEDLIGATIKIVGSHKGTVSDKDGMFELDITQEEVELEISYTGFITRKILVQSEQWIDIVLEEGLQLQSVTVIGSRGAPRSRFDSPVPVDHIDMTALQNTSAQALEQQLAQIIPSFNLGQHPVSDASAHISAIDLRGLLPSRTLVLVNGKRKNPSALLYSYITASRGEVGVDLQSIGSESVEAVEILRDGASAQYGSDAIAGVINLDLKKRVRPFLNAGYGLTRELDGSQLNVSGGYTAKLPLDGFATFTIGYNRQKRSQRAGTITSAQAEAAHWGTDVFSEQDFEAYLLRNPSAGFQVGLPDVNTLNASVNSTIVLDATTDTELYAFGTLMNRTGRSPQFARGPYWVSGFESIYPGQDFFLPEMKPQISDNMLTLGMKHTWKHWRIDLSSTYGKSRLDYNIINSFNQSLGTASPKDFYNGAHQFNHLVNNLDVNKIVYPRQLKSMTIALGIEQRLESFRGFAGEFASYGDGTPETLDRIGSESFSGLSPADAVYGKRNNIGFYSELNIDFTDRLQIGTAARLENYNDFGVNVSWKIDALYKLISDKLNFRGALSNGFRAPALHQIYYTSTTTTLTPEGVVQNRIVNNQDPALKMLQVPRLTPETSLNIGGGFTLKFLDNLSFSIDAYNISVKDRIVLSGQIGRQAELNSPINKFLDLTQTSFAGFFLNAVNTTTQGIDLVFNLENKKIGKGILNASVAANFSSTSVTAINLPEFIEGNELEDAVFSREDISRLETWRPRHKVMLSSTYILDKFSATLSVNNLGAVTYRHPRNTENDATYSPKTITSVSMSYDLHPKIKWQLGVQNLFNVYPETFYEVYDGAPEDRNIDFVGRFQYPWQTIQLGIDGMRIFSKINYKM